MNKFEEFKQEVDAAKAKIFGQIEEIIANTEVEASKFYDKGVKSAGNKVKKAMQDVRKAIKHPAVKAEMSALQNSAKDLRQSIIDSTAVKA
jgi:hypothetical protein